MNKVQQKRLTGGLIVASLIAFILPVLLSSTEDLSIEPQSIPSKNAHDNVDDFIEKKRNEFGLSKLDSEQKNDPTNETQKIEKEIAVELPKENTEEKDPNPQIEDTPPATSNIPPKGANKIAALDKAQSKTQTEKKIISKPLPTSQQPIAKPSAPKKAVEPKKQSNIKKSTNKEQIKKQVRKKKEMNDQGKLQNLLAEIEQKRSSSQSNSGSGKWIVQVGTFGVAQNAKNTEQKIRSADLPAYIRNSNRTGSNLSIVTSGPYTSEAQARAASKKINKLLQVRTVVKEQ